MDRLPYLLFLSLSINNRLPPLFSPISSTMCNPFPFYLTPFPSLFTGLLLPPLGGAGVIFPVSQITTVQVRRFRQHLPRQPPFLSPLTWQVSSALLSSLSYPGFFFSPTILILTVPLVLGHFWLALFFLSSVCQTCSTGPPFFSTRLSTIFSLFLY